MKILKNQDKQNICSNKYFSPLMSSNEISLKERQGINIKNRQKSSFFDSENNLISNRSNMHILNNGMSKNRFLNENSLKNCDKLSTSSSVKSMKSVTFSVNGHDETSSTKKHKNSSILKKRFQKQNKTSSCYLPNFKLEKKLSTSTCSFIRGLDQNKQDLSYQKVIRQKYGKLLKDLKKTNTMYVDPVFPPCENSLFLRSHELKYFNQQLGKVNLKLKWVRITDFYKNSDICVWSPVQKSLVTQGFLSSKKYGNEGYIETIFNGINKNYFMEKFFENQTVNKNGIYYVKIHQTQTNTWRYILIDDLIPVVMTNQEKIVRPAFLNVQSKNNQSGLIQIWPYLLQKAYAKYYSAYDFLLNGNPLDFLEEVSGNFYETLEINYASTIQERKIAENIIKNSYNIVFGESQFFNLKNISKIQNSKIIVEEFDDHGFDTIKLNLMTCSSLKLYYIEAGKYSSHLNCPIRQQTPLTYKQCLQQKRQFILRSFTLQRSSVCHLGVLQKQQRLSRFDFSKNRKYSYSWMRVILVMKQNDGYRWIQGKYGNQKTIKMKMNLQPGQYIVIMMPDWSQKPYNINLALYLNSQTVISSASYFDHKQILEKSCMDLAQTQGKLIQISSNICAYIYIHYGLGLIIENINNEKLNGEVKILRTTDGLEEFNISPTNIDFRRSKRLQINLKSFESYTIVLKMSGKINKHFLSQFDFGN